VLNPRIQKMREMGRTVLVLALAAGFVDAVAYIVLFQIFTAHMSGNTVVMCVQFSRHDWAELLRRGFPIPMFLLGTGLGAFLDQALPRFGLRCAFSFILALEVLLLLLFILLGQSAFIAGGDRLEFNGKYYVLLALLPIAMGLQNATICRMGGNTVHTTYVSGLLTSLTFEIVGYFFRNYDQGRGRFTPSSVDQPSLSRIAFLSCVYTAFVAGAILGGFAEIIWAPASLLIPVCCLCMVIFFDLLRPRLEITK
jgi:uncharacterized membrane protein YoaK (UPF0700 family)